MSPPGTTQTFSDVSFRGPPFMQSGPCTAAGRSRELKQRKFSLVLLPRLLHGHCAVATIAEHDVIDPFHEARGDGVDTLVTRERGSVLPNACITLCITGRRE